MSAVLFHHINRFVPLEEAKFPAIVSLFTEYQFPKRQVLVPEGGLCPPLYFVSSGCLRLYYTDDKGVEQTIQLALEGWWMTDLDAFNKKGKTIYAIQAIENTTVLAITKENLTVLLDDFPALEHYFRMIYERAYGASLFKIKMFRLPKEAIYDSFCDSYPEFVQRIPQKILASFLGFTPEYLSELRKKKLQSKK